MTRDRAPRGNPDPNWNPVRKEWELRIELPAEDGEPRKRKWIRAKTEADCRYRWRVATGQLEDFSVIPSDQITLAQVAGEYLEAQRKRVAAGTLAAYENRLNNHLVPALGNVRLRSLTTKDVDGWQAQLQDQGLALSTRKELRSSLVKMINWAMGQDLVLRNVAARSPGPRGAPGKVESLTRDEAKAVLEAVSGWRLEAAVVLMMTVGLRIGETLGLRWHDISADCTQISIRGQLVTKPSLHYQHSTKTLESTRTVELPKMATAALVAHRERVAQERSALGLEAAEYVFLTESQILIDPSTLAANLKRRTPGLDVHPHKLRHTAASLMIDSKVPLEVVSKVLGHKSIRTTADVYGHLLNRGRAAAASAMDEALG